MAMYIASWISRGCWVLSLLGQVALAVLRVLRLLRQMKLAKIAVIK